MDDFADRRVFLKLAVLFEGGLMAASLALGWAFDIDLVAMLRWNTAALAWGFAATLPLFALFLASIRFRPKPIARIHEILMEILGPWLAACRWYDLIVVAILAGVGEELFFRGVLQVWLGDVGWLKTLPGPDAGLVLASVLFGLAHCITPAYALLAGLMGAYLGLLLDASGERNLLGPILTHALYDYLAFLVVIRLYRRRGADGFDDPDPPENDAMTSRSDASMDD